MYCRICGAAHAACPGDVPSRSVPIGTAMNPDAKNWISPERLYLNSKGRPCGAKDPDKQSLLVPAGGALPYAQALALGLVQASAPAEPATVEEIHVPELDDVLIGGEETATPVEIVETAPKTASKKPAKKK